MSKPNVWMNALPDEAGYYWFKADAHEDPDMVLVCGVPGSMYVQMGHVYIEMVREWSARRGAGDGGWWSRVAPPHFDARLAGL